MGIREPLVWGLRRLSAMPVREIPHRVKEQGTIEVDRLLGMPRTPKLLPAVPAWPELDSRWQPNPALRTALSQGLAGGVMLLQRPFERAQLTWDADPVTGLAFTGRHGFRVRVPTGVDPKWLWELHRLRHLQLWALASSVFGNADGGSLVAAELRDWLGRPAFEGPGWMAGVECAHRVANLLFIRALLPDTLDLDTLIAKSLWAHGLWIERYPSRFSSENNHRVAELCALVALGGVFHSSEQGRRWLEHGAELERVCDRLWCADGTYRERSLSYQARCQEWLLLARWGAGERSPDLDATLASSAAFLRDMLSSANWMPRIGDDDASVIFDEGGPRRDYEASVVMATAASLGRDDLIPVHTPVGAPDGTLSEAANAYPASRVFLEGGISVLRGGDDLGLEVWFSHGEVGLPPLHAHAHDHQLAVWLAVDGEPVLVDSGTFAYAGQSGWRRYLRSAAAHNTFRVTGVTGMRQRGPFLWGPASACWLEGASKRRGIVEAGYRPPATGGYLRRKVQLMGGVVRLTDEVRLDEEGPIEWWFHVHPSVSCEAKDGGVVFGGRHWSGQLWVPPGLRLSVVRGSGLPGAGMWSPSYGQIEPSTTVHLQAPRGANPLVVDLRFEFTRVGEAPP